MIDFSIIINQVDKCNHVIPEIHSESDSPNAKKSYTDDEELHFPYKVIQIAAFQCNVIGLGILNHYVFVWLHCQSQ